MPEPLTLFALALGQAAGPLIRKAAEDHVENFFGDRLKDLARLGRKKPTVEAMERAWGSCVELVLDHVRVLGDFDPEELADDEAFRAYGEALKRLLDDKAVGAELLKPLLELDEDAPEAAVLRDAWQRHGGPEMPTGFSWDRVTRGYRQRLEKRRLLTAELHDQLNAENLVKVRQLLEARVGVLPRGDEARYAQRMREKYRVLDLSAMRPPTSDETGQILLREAFMPQKVREDPPPVELPRDVVRRLIEEGIQPEDAEKADEVTAWQLERVRENYSLRLPEPVLEVVGAPRNRRVVLVGGPGSGKSTLTRYLLLATFDPPRDPETGEPPAWTRAFRGHLPLLVELREFITHYADRRCDNFLEFWHFLGKSEKYHLDQGWVDERLRDGPSLVLFDGLDEIFEAKERERVMQAIVGFAGTYPEAKVVVTTRPVGYLGYGDNVLRSAGFRHYALEDLDDEQIESFVTEWFRRLFPDQEKEAALRRQRILKATRSPAVRLLAGNPMLLTIMALIAQLREIPRERWRFYDHAADVLCHHWDVNRHLEEAGFSDYVGLEDKKELLRRIAFHMQQGEGGLAGNVIREPELREQVEGYLHERFGLAGVEAKQLTRRLIRQLRERNYVLCLRGPKVYGFVHRTFLEYFCAAELVRKVREDPDYGIEELRDEIFAGHWRDTAWREVLLLIGGMVGEQNMALLITYLTDSAYPDWRWKIQTDPPVNLVLAMQCLSEVRNRRLLDEQSLAVVQALVEAATYLDPHEGQNYGELLSEGLLAGRSEYNLSGSAKEWFEKEWDKVLRGTKSFHVRRCLASLAGIWLSNSPRKMLRNRALHDENEYVRRAALEALAQGWAQESAIRDLLRERTLQDENRGVRIAALEALARNWAQEPATLYFLRQRALQDDDFAVRVAALKTLVRGWSKESVTRALLRERALQDENEYVRRAALEALAWGWSQESATRDLLRERALLDKSVNVRTGALLALALGWAQEPTTWELLRLRALEDDDSFVRGWALRALARGWAQELVTRDFLREQALQDENFHIRRAALEALVSGWSQESATRDLLRERALRDEHGFVRHAALKALARGWPQEPATRDLLRQRALQDEIGGVRSTALRALAQGWSHESATRDLLRERALLDEDENLRRSAYKVLARIVLAPPAYFLLSGLTSGSRFPDPLRAIPGDRLSNRASRIHLDVTEARELLASCEDVLGWNPLEGGGAFPAKPGDMPTQHSRDVRGGPPGGGRRRESP